MNQLNKNNQSWLIMLLIFFMAVSIFFLPQFLTSTINLMGRPSLSAAGANSKVTLPDNLTVSARTAFSLPVNVDTDNAAIQQADIQLHFDKSKLTFTNINPVASENTNLKDFSPKDKSGFFDKSKVLKEGNHSGTISFSAKTMDPSQPYTGTTVLAILTFEPKKLGTTNLYFDFFAGKTIGTTDLLVDPSSNILSAVTNSSVTIVIITPLPTSPSAQVGLKTQLVGDLNHDGVVNQSDMDLFLQDFSKTGAPGFSPADLNNDGRVDIFDKNILQQNIGKHI